MHVLRIAIKIVQKDLQRRIKSPISLILILCFPLILCLIIGLAFDPVREGAPPVTEILIADHDRDVLSRVLKSAFQSTSDDAPPVDLREVSEAEGRRAISAGEGSALLIIPDDFSYHFFRGENVTLTLLKNPSQAILPEIAEQYTDILSLFGSYVSRFFDKEISTIREYADRDGLGSPLEWTALTLRFHGKFKTVEKYLFPVPLSVGAPTGEEKKKENEKGESGSGGGSTGGGFNIFEYLLPGLAVFGIFFLAQVSYRDILAERDQRTLARLLTAPVSVEAFLLGKVLSAFLITLLGLFLVQVVGVVGFGIDWGPPWLVLVANLVGILAMSGICLLVYSLARTQDQGRAILMAVIVFMALFGGSFIPLDTLPRFFNRVADFTFNGNAIAVYNRLLFEGKLLPEWPRLLGLSSVGIVGFVAGGVLLRRRLQRSL